MVELAFSSNNWLDVSMQAILLACSFSPYVRHHPKSETIVATENSVEQQIRIL